MTIPIRPEDIHDPSRILSNMISDYIAGNLGGTHFLYRASVVEVDPIGGKLAGPGTPHDGDPPNPKNSIRARIITNAYNSITPDKDLPVLWSFFPYDRMPIKEGEHVYVIFEDEGKTHGLWLTRIPEPNDVDNPNITPGIKKYQAATGNVSPEKSVQDTPKDPGTAKVDKDFTSEKVPNLIGRTGDRVIEGSNNTAIIFSRDSKEKSKSGTIDIVTGRKDEKLDLKEDDSRIFVSMNSDVDGDFSVNVGTKGSAGPSIVVKSDEIRIIARKGMKIVVEGGDISIDGANVNIGNKPTEPAVLGTALDTYLKTCVVSTPAGPGALQPPPPTILSQTVKIKS